MFYLLLVAGLPFPRYVFSVLLEFFVRLYFAFSAPVCPRFVVWKRFSHLVKHLVQAVWGQYFGQLCPHGDGHEHRLSFRFISFLCFRQIQDPDGILLVLAKIFPARLSEAESLQLSFSSPVFSSFTHRLSSVSGVTHHVINKNKQMYTTPSARSMTLVFKT